MNQSDDTPAQPMPKPMPWLKIMALFVLFMIVGAVLVQVYKARKSAELDKLRQEQMEANRRDEAKKAVAMSREALTDKQLDNAERYIKLALGLDTEGEHTAELERIKLMYATLKAEAEKEAEALSTRDASARTQLTHLLKLVNNENIEKSKLVVDEKIVSLNQLKSEGLSETVLLEIDEVFKLIEGEKVKVNINALKKLIVAASSQTAEQQIKQSMEEIKTRASQSEVPALLKDKAAQALTELQKKLDQISNIKVFEAKIKNEQWLEAEQSLADLTSKGLDQVLADQYKQKLLDAKEQARERDERINDLLGELKAMDTSNFNAAALFLVEQILSEKPDHAEAIAIQQKLRQHLDLLRVPGDVASLDEAVRLLNRNGRIILGEGNFYSELTITKPLRIEGQGAGKTVLESRAEDGPALYFNHKDGASALSKLSITGTKFNGDNERNALLLISSDLLVEDCEVSKSPGHGFAVLSGKVELKRCKSFLNGWDGLTVKGRDSQVTATDCLFEQNSEHGVDFWDGAAGTLFRCKVTSSSGSGVVVTGRSRVTVAQTTVEKSGESGVHISGGAVAKLDKVVSRENSFSGIAVQDAGTLAEMSVVASADNGQAGYFIDPASQVQGIEMATGEGNKEGKVVRKSSP